MEHDDKINRHVKFLEGWALLEMIVFFAIKFINYGLMLVAMTFNFWIILTLCLGLAIADFMVNIIKDRIYVKKYIHYIAFKEF